MMPSWCQCVMATHPLKSSTPVLLPIQILQDRYSLQSISGAKYHPKQPGPFKANNSLSAAVLHSLGESCYSSSHGARLHCLSTALSFMHESVEPNSLHSWGGTEAGLSPGMSAYRRAASEVKSAHHAEM